MATKYAPLQRQLMQTQASRVRLSFGEIETVLGFPLPKSARAYAPWWANTGGSHTQAAAWMDAGWRTCQVDVPGEKVTFERSDPMEFSPLQSGEATPVRETAATFVADEAIVISRDVLRGGAVRMLEDYREAQGGSLADAAASLLNAMFVERRRQLLERFPLTGKPSPIDSVDLIREERDAR